MRAVGRVLHVRELLSPLPFLPLSACGWGGGDHLLATERCHEPLRQAGMVLRASGDPEAARALFGSGAGQMIPRDYSFEAARE